MQGRQEFQAKLFSTVNLEELIPKNHLLRKLDQVLDLSFIREETKELYCLDNGRPSIDPELFFRMVLIEYFFNINSDRQLCEEIGFNLAYRWYCRLSMEDKVPDHSSLTRIRDRLGEAVFKKVFLHIIELCRKQGLAKAQKVMTDGSWIQANAALNSLTERNPKNEESNDQDADGSGNGTRDGTSAKKKRKSILGKKLSNEEHVSSTDPDATLAGKDGMAKSLKYKIHQTADAESRVILDCHVTSGNVHDSKPYQDRIKVIEETFNTKITEAMADRGYGSGENLQFLKNKKIDSYVPRYHKDVGDKINREDTIYDEVTNEFKCKEGNVLEQRGGDRDKMIAYRPKIGSCNSCHAKNFCFIKRHGLRVNPFHVVQFETKLKEQTDAFKKKMGERQWKAEGLFAEAKEYHGLTHAKYRGRAKMQIQAYLTTSVQNLKRLMKAVTPPFLQNPWPRGGIYEIEKTFANLIRILITRPRTN